MASGQIFGLVPVPPDANFATEDWIAGASTPAENVPVWNFDDTTIEYMDFYGMAQGYGGSGFTLRLPIAGAAASGNLVPSAAIRAIPSDTEDLDTTAHTYDYNDATATAAPSVIGEMIYIDITFTEGGDADSLADGEGFILRVRRNTGASDTMSGDMRLGHNLVFRET